MCTDVSNSSHPYARVKEATVELPRSGSTAGWLRPKADTKAKADVKDDDGDDDAMMTPG